MSIPELLKRPTGFFPLALSAGAILTIVIHIALAGTAPQADEGTAAHIWQLLMALQLPAVGLFALLWLPRAPRQAAVVLGLQIVAIVVALAPVAIFKW
jgi:hypothetical protein